MSLGLPEPEGLSLADWSAALSDLVRNETVPSISSETYWREWACGLFYLPAFRSAPTPENFQDWRAWASAVVQTI
jgi:hypothetical protein